MDIALLCEILQDPELYGEPISSVEVREPHISLVFLTDRHAYKVKKPVDLGFLDFSSLDRHRFYCDEGLRLNRRLSSGVYLEVLALHEANGDYTFDGPGRIVGRDAEALIAEEVLTVEMSAVAQDLALTVHPHPTLSGTVGEAAAMFRGEATHMLGRND